MKMELPDIGPGERTPLVETLLGVIRQLMDRVAELERSHQELRDENARLKGQKARPDIKPSTLEEPEKPTDGGGAGTEKGRRRGKPTGPRTDELVIHETTQVEPPDLPPGATFRQFEPLVIQDLKLETWNTKYERARYNLPGGGSVLAPLPEGVLPVEGGHFGVKLVAFILSQHYQAMVTQPVLLELLWDYGIVISAGQLHSILTEHKDHFHKEKAEVLAAGLTTATYIGTDDTGARHQGKNGFTTAIGNDLFAYFETTDSKSRLNFLHVLQGDLRTYVINETALVYWNQQGLSEVLLNNLTKGPREFAGEEAWKARLAELRITNERHVRIAWPRWTRRGMPTTERNADSKIQQPWNKRSPTSLSSGTRFGPKPRLASLALPCFFPPCVDAATLHSAVVWAWLNDSSIRKHCLSL